MNQMYYSMTSLFEACQYFFYNKYLCQRWRSYMTQCHVTIRHTSFPILLCLFLCLTTSNFPSLYLKNDFCFLCSSFFIDSGFSPSFWTMAPGLHSPEVLPWSSSKVHISCHISTLHMTSFALCYVQFIIWCFFRYWLIFSFSFFSFLFCPYNPKNSRSFLYSLYKVYCPAWRRCLENVASVKNYI